jgi:hypothetical protein
VLKKWPPPMGLVRIGEPLFLAFRSGNQPRQHGLGGGLVRVQRDALHAAIGIADATIPLRGLLFLPATAGAQVAVFVLGLGRPDSVTLAFAALLAELPLALGIGL